MHHITVLPAYRTIAQYADAARTHPPTDRDRLYHQQVVEPVWQQVVAGGEYDHIAQYAFAAPTAEFPALVDAATQLDRLSIEARIEAILHRAADTLPSRATTVCVLPLDPRDTVARDHLHGITGYCPGAGRIVIHINPNSPNWATWLAYTLTHEYHHSVWCSYRVWWIIRHLLQTRFLGGCT